MENLTTSDLCFLVSMLMIKKEDYRELLLVVSSEMRSVYECRIAYIDSLIKKLE